MTDNLNSNSTNQANQVNPINQFKEDICPFCGGDGCMVDSYDNEMDPHSWTYEMECCRCNAKWKQAYRLQYIETFDEEEGLPIKFNYNNNTNVQFNVSNQSVTYKGVEIPSQDLWAIVHGSKVMETAEQVNRLSPELNPHECWSVADKVVDTCLNDDEINAIEFYKLDKNVTDYMKNKEGK